MIRRLRSATRRLLNALGYEVSPRLAAHAYHVHDYADLRFILDGVANPVIFDVGANVGDTVARFLRLFPEAKLVAVEANPGVARRLEARFATDSRVTVRCAAAWHESSEITFHFNDSPDGLETWGSALPWKPDSENAGRIVATATVAARTIASIAEEAGVARIDVLKLDVEGAELEALKGAEGWLEGGRVATILAEVRFADLDFQGQAMFRDLDEYLEARGFVLYGLYNTTQPFIAPNQPLRMADAIFVHRSHLPSLRPLTTVVVEGRRTPLNGGV